MRYYFGTVMRFPILYHYALAQLNLKCSTRGFPSYRALIFFCWPRWNNFQDIEGRYHVRPSPWYLFSLRWMSHNFYAEIRVFVILCPIRAFLDFAIFRWLKFRYFSQGYQRTNSIFNLLLPFWGHCALLFWYRYALSFLCHYALAEFGVWKSAQRS